MRFSNHPPRCRGIVRFALGTYILLASHVHAQVVLNPHRVTFYTEPNYRGEALAIEAGASVESLDRVRRSDQKPWTFAISSVRVEGSARAVVHSAVGFRGDRLEIAASIPDLYAVPRGQERGATWDRTIASVSVLGARPAVTATPPVRYEPAPTTVYVVPQPTTPPPVVHEVRPLFNRRTAEAAVHRAYRDILNRDPDPAGLRTYRDRLLRDGWTEDRLFDELKRSPEARSIRPEEAIAQAYRDILGREPDPTGLAHYRARWRDGWTQGRIREDLRRSAEGRNAHIRSAIERAYRDLLARDPDPSGYQTFEKLMREKGWSEQQVRSAIRSSEEYRSRSGRK